MHWFWIALLAPLFFSLSVQVDKILLSKYFKNSGVGVIVTSAFSTLVFLVPAWFFAETVRLPLHDIFSFLMVGVIDIAYLYPYLLALKKDEASLVAPLFQMIPVLYLIAGYFFLGETVSSIQLLGSAIIIFASLTLVFNFQRWKWEWPVFFLMLGASLLIVAGGILFKDSALESNFAGALFWQYLGSFLVSLFLLCFSPFRKTLLHVWSKKTTLVPLTLFNEAVNLLALIAIRFASLLAPIGLVQSVGGFHPLFIFMWGTLGMLFLPKMGFQEDLSQDSIIKKISAGLFLLFGAWLIQ